MTSQFIVSSEHLEPAKVLSPASHSLTSLDGLTVPVDTTDKITSTASSSMYLSTGYPSSNMMSGTGILDESFTSKMNSSVGQCFSTLLAEQVTSDAEESSMNDSISSMDPRNFLVAQLHPSITDKDLRELFEPFGVVKRAIIVIDTVTGRSRGFGFVTFAEDAAGEKAMAEMHHKEIRDRKIRVERSAKPNTVTESDAVWIRNMPVSLSTAQIASIVRKFGKVVSLERKVESPRNKWRIKLNYVCVHYASVAVAKRAIAALHGQRQVICPNGVCLDLKVPLAARFYSEECDKPRLAPSKPAAAAAPAKDATTGWPVAPPQPQFAAMQPMPGMVPAMMPMMPMVPGMMGMTGGVMHTSPMQPSAPFHQQLPYGAMMMPQPHVQPQYHVALPPTVETSVPQPLLSLNGLQYALVPATPAAPLL